MADSSIVDMENGLATPVRGRAVRGRGLSESSLGGAHVIRGGGVKPHCRASLYEGSCGGFDSTAAVISFRTAVL